MTSHVETIYTSRKKLSKSGTRNSSREIDRSGLLNKHLISVKPRNICYIGVNGISIPQPLFM